MGEGAHEHYPSVGVPLQSRAAYADGVTTRERLSPVSGPVPALAPEPSSLDALVADCAEVTRHLAEVPRPRVITIPARAVALVAGMGSYGD